MMNDLIQAKTENKTGYRRKDSVWGKVCSWFDTDDWGWESYSYKKQFYEIDIPKIRESASKDIQRIFNGLEQDVTQKIRQPLQDGIGDFFRRSPHNCRTDPR